jgi:hypothetical protein
LVSDSPFLGRLPMASSTPTEGLTLALENQTRALLAELDKRFLAMDTKWNSRIVDLESRVSASERSMSDFSSGLRSDVEAHLTAADAAVDAKLVQIEAETQSRVSALESAVYSFEIWRPRIDSSVESLQATVGWLRSEAPRRDVQWHRDARVDSSIPAATGGGQASVLGRPPSPSLVTDGPQIGHRNNNFHRGSGFGHSGAEFHYPVTGTWHHHYSPQFAFPHPSDFVHKITHPDTWEGCQS